MKIAVANFKANFTESEAESWLEQFEQLSNSAHVINRELIVCPPLLYLDLFRNRQVQKKLPFLLGSQILSAKSEGSYTGEVTAKMLSSYVQYVIIGHSEERVLRNLTNKDIQEKINSANSQGLKVILCAETPEVYSGNIFALAYEPSSAIGTGAAADPMVGFQAAQQISGSLKPQYLFYGGSVDRNNVAEYTQAGFDGVLVGKKSLDPSEFLAIVNGL